MGAAFQGKVFWGLIVFDYSLRALARGRVGDVRRKIRIKPCGLDQSGCDPTSFDPSLRASLISPFRVLARGHARLACEHASARSDYKKESRVRGAGKDRASFPFPLPLAARFARHKWRACSQANLTP